MHSKTLLREEKMLCIPVSGEGVSCGADVRTCHSQHIGYHTPYIEWWQVFPHRHGYHMLGVADREYRLDCSPIHPMSISLHGPGSTHTVKLMITITVKYKDEKNVTKKNTRYITNTLNTMSICMMFVHVSLISERHIHWTIKWWSVSLALFLDIRIST